MPYPPSTTTFNGMQPCKPSLRAKPMQSCYKKLTCPGTKFTRNTFTKSFQKPSGHAILATTSSMEISTKSHQCGGTLQAIVGSWTLQTINHGQDHSGMGWWSFIEIQGKEDKWYIIVSGYRVGNNQQVDFGSNNTYNQQYRILHQKATMLRTQETPLWTTLSHKSNYGEPKRRQFLFVLTNKNPQQTSSTGITKLFQETNHLDLHTKHHPQQNHPPTYNCSTTPIDLCAGSPEFAKALVVVWTPPRPQR